MSKSPQPDRLKLFVSYDPKSVHTVRHFLTEGLRELSIDIDPFLDHERRKDFPACLQELRKSDLLFAFVTDDYLESTHRAEEISRASELGLPIYAVVQASSKHPNMSDEAETRYAGVRWERKVPLNEAPSDGSIRSAFSNVLTRLKNDIDSPAHFEALLVRRDVRLNLQWLAGQETFRRLIESPRGVRQLVRALADDHHRELSKAFTEPFFYDVDLGRDRDFLLRASAMFSSAKEVFAVSRAGVSGFWIDKDKKEPVVKYTLSQISDCIRLFSFSNPEDLNSYKHVLDLHDECYGGSGAVFITTDEWLEQILDDTRFPRRTVRDVDFGLLHYHAEEAPAPDNDVWVYAELGKDSLTFRRLTKKGPIDENIGRYAHFVEYLKRAKKETDHRRRDDVVPASLQMETSELHLLRWRPALHKSAWGAVLKHLFEEDRREDNVEHKHIVLFKPSAYRDGRREEHTDQQFVTMLQSVCSDIINVFTKEMNIRHPKVWVGRRRAPDVRDFKSGAELYTNIGFDDWKYMLIVDFEDYDTMEAWYRHRRHSEIRKTVYTALKPEVEAPYKMLADDSKLDADFKKAIWTMIENAVRDSLWRLDFGQLFDFDAVAQFPVAISAEDLQRLAQQVRIDQGTAEVDPAGRPRK